MARRFRRGMSAFRLALETSSSLIAFNACDLSMMRFMRAISTEMNAATAPRRNEGAVTWTMTWDSCAAEGVSTATLRWMNWGGATSGMARRRRTGTSAPTLGPTHMAGKGRAGTGDGASEKASGRVTIRED